MRVLIGEDADARRRAGKTVIARSDCRYRAFAAVKVVSHAVGIGYAVVTAGVLPSVRPRISFMIIPNAPVVPGRGDDDAPGERGTP